MHQAVIYIDPVGAAPVGFAQAAGMPGDIRFDFKTQGNLAYPDVASLYPQLVLRPFTRPDVHAYDIEINDPTGASGIATVPGVVMNDRFNVEVYARNSIGQPQRMLACGRVDLNGYGYVSSGPLGPASYPTGPEGPAGPAGCVRRAGAPRRPGPARIALVHRRRGSRRLRTRTSGCRATCTWTKAPPTSGAGTAWRGAAMGAWPAMWNPEINIKGPPGPQDLPGADSTVPGPPGPAGDRTGLRSPAGPAGRPAGTADECGPAGGSRYGCRRHFAQIRPRGSRSSARPRRRGRRSGLWYRRRRRWVRRTTRSGSRATPACSTSNTTTAPRRSG